MLRRACLALAVLAALGGAASANRGRMGAPRPPRTAAVGEVMPARDAARLAARLDARGWDEDRLPLLRREVRGKRIGGAELLALLQPFRFSHHRLAALEILAPRRLGRDADEAIVASFLFGRDRARAREILAAGAR